MEKKEGNDFAYHFELINFTGHALSPKGNPPVASMILIILMVLAIYNF